MNAQDVRALSAVAGSSKDALVVLDLMKEEEGRFTIHPGYLWTEGEATPQRLIDMPELMDLLRFGTDIVSAMIPLVDRRALEGFYRVVADTESVATTKTAEVLWKRGVKAQRVVTHMFPSAAFTKASRERALLSSDGTVRSTALARFGSAADEDIFVASVTFRNRRGKPLQSMGVERLPDAILTRAGRLATQDDDVRARLVASARAEVVASILASITDPEEMKISLKILLEAATLDWTLPQIEPFFLAQSVGTRIELLGLTTMFPYVVHSADWKNPLEDPSVQEVFSWMRERSMSRQDLTALIEREGSRAQGAIALLLDPWVTSLEEHKRVVGEYNVTARTAEKFTVIANSSPHDIVTAYGVDISALICFPVWQGQPGEHLIHATADRLIADDDFMCAYLANLARPVTESSTHRFRRIPIWNSLYDRKKQLTLARRIIEFAPSDPKIGWQTVEHVLGRLADHDGVLSPTQEWRDRFDGVPTSDPDEVRTYERTSTHRKEAPVPIEEIASAAAEAGVTPFEHLVAMLKTEKSHAETTAEPSGSASSR